MAELLVTCLVIEIVGDQHGGLSGLVLEACGSRGHVPVWGTGSWTQ